MKNQAWTILRPDAVAMLRLLKEKNNYLVQERDAEEPIAGAFRKRQPLRGTSYLLLPHTRVQRVLWRLTPQRRQPSEPHQHHHLAHMAGTRKEAVTHRHKLEWGPPG
jgi:hypothetical protein